MTDVLHHKQFLASMSPEDRALLREKSDAPGLMHLAIHVALILGFGFYIATGWFAWQFLLLPQGLALVFLFTLQHECTHKTPFKTVWINEVVGTVVGLIIIQPFYEFRAFHMEHHRFTNHPERDPELMAGFKPESWWEFGIHVLTFKYWWDKVMLLIKHAAGVVSGSYIPRKEHRALRWEARGYLVFYACLLLYSLLATSVLLWVWLVPVMLGFPFLRLYLLAEHGRCPAVENMFHNTRTTYTNLLVRFIAWNMPYHTEHHVLPSVPFHRLPQFHDQVRSHLLCTSNGYTGFTKEYVSEFDSRDTT